MGRNKIRIEKIKNERNRNVTFIKRKKGWIKKAMELAVLCDADIWVTVVSKENVVPMTIFSTFGKFEDYYNRYWNKTPKEFEFCCLQDYKSFISEECDNQQGNLTNNTQKAQEDNKKVIVGDTTNIFKSSKKELCNQADLSGECISKDKENSNNNISNERKVNEEKNCDLREKHIQMNPNNQRNMFNYFPMDFSFTNVNNWFSHAQNIDNLLHQKHEQDNQKYIQYFYNFLPHNDNTLNNLTYLYSNSNFSNSNSQSSNSNTNSHGNNVFINNWYSPQWQTFAVGNCALFPHTNILSIPLDKKY